MFSLSMFPVNFETLDMVPNVNRRTLKLNLPPPPLGVWEYSYDFSGLSGGGHPRREGHGGAYQGHRRVQVPQKGHFR
jgi:hypothetical protein